MQTLEQINENLSIEEKGVVLINLIQLVNSKDINMEYISPNMIGINESFDLTMIHEEVSLDYVDPQVIFPSHSRNKNFESSREKTLFSLGCVIFYLFNNKSYYEVNNKKLCDFVTQRSESLICKRAWNNELYSVAVEQLTSYENSREMGVQSLEQVLKEQYPYNFTPMYLLFNLQNVEKRRILLINKNTKMGIKISSILPNDCLEFWLENVNTNEISHVKNVNIETISDEGEVILVVEPRQQLVHIRDEGDAKNEWNFKLR